MLFRSGTQVPSRLAASQLVANSLQANTIAPSVGLLIPELVSWRDEGKSRLGFLFGGSLFGILPIAMCLFAIAVQWTIAQAP